jgi:hypothetical protein
MHPNRWAWRAAPSSGAVKLRYRQSETEARNATSRRGELTKRWAQARSPDPMSTASMPAGNEPREISRNFSAKGRHPQGAESKGVRGSCPCCFLATIPRDDVLLRGTKKGGVRSTPPSSTDSTPGGHSKVEPPTVALVLSYGQDGPGHGAVIGTGARIGSRPSEV